MVVINGYSNSAHWSRAFTFAGLLWLRQKVWMIRIISVLFSRLAILHDFYLLFRGSRPTRCRPSMSLYKQSYEFVGMG